MHSPKRFRPEVEAPPEPKSDIEKDLDRLQSIRQSRLEKKESAYRREKKKHQDAKSKLEYEQKKVQDLQKEILQKKNDMTSEYLNDPTNGHQVLLWTERERNLDDTLHDAIKRLIPFQEQVDKTKQSLLRSKTLFRQAQIGIDKLGILKEELEKEKER